MASKDLVVGVVFPAKKISHLRDILRVNKDGVRFVLIDLFDNAITSPDSITTKYGHVDVILHKLAHEMVFARFGDAAAAKRLQLMKDFIAMHPSLTVLDPIESVQILTDRYETCQMLLHLRSTTTAAFNVPRFHIVDSNDQFQALHHVLDTNEMSLPLICKSVEACGTLFTFLDSPLLTFHIATDRSHMMSIITKRSDLEYVNFPVIYQEFVNHSGRLFKGYVLGTLINVAERQSLPNVCENASHVQFNTQEQYPSVSDFYTVPTSTNTSNDSSPRTQQELFAAVRAIGKQIQETLHLSLFGYDVIVSEMTQELYVIDVNYFPSYKELTEFDDLLRRHIRTTSLEK